jgi:hypothetical protein
MFMSSISGYIVTDIYCFGKELNPAGKDYGSSWFPEVPIPPFIVFQVSSQNACEFYLLF